MNRLPADVNRRNFSAARSGPPQQRQLKTEILKFKVNTITKQPLPQHALPQDGVGSGKLLTKQAGPDNIISLQD